MIKNLFKNLKGPFYMYIDKPIPSSRLHQPVSNQ